MNFIYDDSDNEENNTSLNQSELKMSEILMLEAVKTESFILCSTTYSTTIMFFIIAAVVFKFITQESHVVIIFLNFNKML